MLHRRLDVKGRGFALRDAWSASSATVLAYLDVDLSTDLAALPPLVAPLVSGIRMFPSGPGWGRVPGLAGARSVSSFPARTIFCSEDHAGEVLRCPMWFQSHPRGCRQADPSPR